MKMPLPGSGGISAWNSFTRIYNPTLSYPIYSSLIVGDWDITTGNGGGNTIVYNQFKTNKGIVVVGMHTSDANNVPNGNPVPVINVLPWGNSTPLGQSALLAYYQDESIQNNNDGPTVEVYQTKKNNIDFTVYPNPTDEYLVINNNNPLNTIEIIDFSGKIRLSITNVENNTFRIDLKGYEPGIYLVRINRVFSRKIIICK